ncbi:MAG TPA: hypothetical protein VGM44_17205, partial [Polyangiaceae bacterium]
MKTAVGIGVAWLMLVGCGGRVISLPDPDGSGAAQGGSGKGAISSGGATTMAGGSGLATTGGTTADGGGAPSGGAEAGDGSTTAEAMPARSEVVLIASDMSAKVVANPPIEQSAFEAQHLWVESSNLMIGPDGNSADGIAARWFGEVHNFGRVPICAPMIEITFSTADGASFLIEATVEGVPYFSLEAGRHWLCLAVGQSAPAYYFAPNVQVAAEQVQSAKIGTGSFVDKDNVLDPAAPDVTSSNVVNGPSGNVLEGIAKGSATSVTNLQLAFYPNVGGFLVDRMTATRGSLAPDELWTFDTTPHE